jgi:hypothetical protein
MSNPSFPWFANTLSLKIIDDRVEASDDRRVKKSELNGDVQPVFRVNSLDEIDALF